MDRRVFVSSVASGVLGVALAATAQTSPSSTYRPRFLWLGVGAPDPPDQIKQQDGALAEVGWIVGQDVLIDRRDVTFENLSRTAQEFVTAKVDLIVANGAAATLAARNATTSIPILMFAKAPRQTRFPSYSAGRGSNCWIHASGRTRLWPFCWLDLASP